MMRSPHSITAILAAGLLLLTASPVAAQGGGRGDDQSPHGVLTISFTLDEAGGSLTELAQAAVASAEVGYEGGESSLDDVVLDTLVVPGPTWQPGEAWLPTTSWLPGNTWNAGPAWHSGAAWRPGSKWFPGTVWEPGPTWIPGSTWNPDSAWQQGDALIPGSTWEPTADWDPGTTWIPGDTWLPEDDWLSRKTIATISGRCAGSEAVLLVAARAATPEAAEYVGSNATAVCLTRKMDGRITPIPGRWVAVETSRVAECAKPIGLNPRPDVIGRILVSLDGERIGADGFVAGQKARAKLQRSATDPPAYLGEGTTKEQGGKAKAAITWEVIDERTMIGTTTATFRVGGEPCSVVRTVDMELETPER